MKIVSDNIKNVLKKPTTQRKGKILVDGNYYEVYNVEYYADSYEDGNVIGNAIASQLDFDLPYMEKFNTFKYFDGVWIGKDYEYVDMGTFTVFDEQDEDEFNKHITAFDNLIKFNAPFEEVGTYPKTLYEELQNICQQAGVELVNTTIPNGSFKLENNQFVNGETLKTVLKAICQISGNYGIIKEDKLVLQLTNDTDETIIKNQHEPVVWKRKTYGINQVILQLGDVEGEYVIRQDEEDIAENGLHKLVITNNPFAYTQNKRDALIDELFNQVRGFGYIPYEMNGEWLNYLDIGDKITIDGIETLVLRIQGKSPKGLESFISAPAIIDSAVEYVDNTNNIKNQISRTEIIVDKQNQEIELIASKTEETAKTLKTDKSVESNGEEIYIEDSGGYDLEKLRIDGKSIQNGTPTPDTPEKIESVGYTNLIPTNESEWEQGTINGGNNENSTTRLRTKNYIEINDNTLHTFRLENALIGNVWFYDEQKQVVNNLYDMIYKTGMKSVEFTTPKNTKYYKVVIRYEDNSVITSQAISEIKPMIEEGSVAHHYIPFGKYGIEVKVTNGTETNTKVLVLNEPLRSLPNGVKDKAYIKNNKLYVDRYVGSIVLNGNEEYSYSVGNRITLLKDINLKTTSIYEIGHVMCDRYIETGNGDADNYDYAITRYSKTSAYNYEKLVFKNKDISSVNEFKTWLSNNNVRVNYELATPVTEEIDFLSIPTFKNINHINLYGKISTSFGITYLTDSYLNEQFATKSEIKITNDEINILSKKIQPVSNTIQRTGEIKLENASEGPLHKLSIKGSISLIYPNDNLFPSSNLSPKSFKLQVDEILYDLDINYLNYINENVCDEFVYEDGNCYIIRRVGITENGEMYELPNEIFEEREGLFINVLENSTITLLGFGNTILTAEYLLQNQYTDVFATEAYVNSEIKQTADEINIEVSKKVNEDEVVSAINLSPDKITLDSNRLEINSTYFKLDEEGRITSTSGKIGGYNLEADNFNTEIKTELGFNLDTQEEFNAIGTKINNYISGSGTLTNEELELYDINDDGTVDRNDLLRIQRIFYGYEKLNGTFKIDSTDGTKTLVFKSDDGEVTGYLGLNGFKTNNFTTDFATVTNSMIAENVTINGNFTNNSDLRLKHDINVLDDNYVNVVKELNPVSFVYNQNNTKHIGFIAQDMEEVFKNNNLEAIPVKIDEVGMYSINYINLIGILWKDNQYLHKEIEKLKEMIK